MPLKLTEMKAQLAELAPVLNSFKSEAVQLKLLEFLLKGDSNEGDPTSTDSPTPKRVQRKRRNRVPKGNTVAPDASAKKDDKKKPSPSGSGAVATLTQLLQGDFFSKYRTINDIVEHCKHKLARNFKANEFSGKLGRMVRDNELIRQQNADSQYEYKKP